MANKGIIAKAADTAPVLAEKKPATIQQYIQRMQGEIAKALPSVITPERFTRIVLSAISSNPKLAECTPQSFLGAMMTSAQLGCEVNTPLGQAYLIPRWNSAKGVNECQFQLGYKGLIDLAYRSGEVTMIGAHVVYANDEFEYELGLEPVLRHKPAISNRGDPIYVYAMFRTKDGGYGFECMSMEDIRKHAQQFSDAYKKGYFSPWKSNFEEMAKKTVLKKVLKYAPLKTDFARQMSADEVVKNTISDDMFAEPAEYIDITDLEEVAESDGIEQSGV